MVQGTEILQVQPDWIYFMNIFDRWRGSSDESIGGSSECFIKKKKNWRYTPFCKKKKKKKKNIERQKKIALSLSSTIVLNPSKLTSEYTIS